MSNEPKPINKDEVPPIGSCAEIRFDCLVKMFDSGQIVIKGMPLLGVEEKPLAPQWFKLENRITLDAIRHADPYALGMTFKNMIQQMDLHISKYEHQPQ